MMNFVDGPAATVVLNLRRAPVMLRVVRNKLARVGENAWDCLNELDDVAKPHEEIFVYRLVDRPTSMHIRAAKRSASGFFYVGKYAFLQEQPPDEVLRSNEKWSAWCDANKDRLMPAWANVGGDQ